jgi:Na+-driven multidrug efflux pump
MIIGCLTNVVLDALFIFIFGMGIKGAALATITSQALTAVLTMTYYMSGKSNLKFTKSSLKLDKKLALGVFAIGISPFAMQIAASMVQVISNHALKAYGGDLAIGAMTTISSISMIFLMPIFGINQGSQPIIGFNYGAKQYKRSKKAYIVSLCAATTILCIGSGIIQLFPQKIIGLFNKDEELMKMSVEGIRVYLFMLPLVGISITGSNYVQSIGKAKVAMFLSLLRQVILLIPAIIILPRFFNLRGVWLAQPIADFIAIIITTIVIIIEMRSYNKEEIKIKTEFAIERDSNELI